MKQVRLIKVGGSLWSYDALVPALRDWLAAQPPAVNVLLVGGGPFADTVRNIDRRFGLDSEKAHWLCVRLMDVSARMMSLLLPEAQFIDRYEELRRTLESPGSEGLVLFSSEEFMQRHEPQVPGLRLPSDWSTTSDSIAARLAHTLMATDLVLLKSHDPPKPVKLAHLSHCGYVDAFFCQAAAGLPKVRFINLRG